MNSMSLIQTHFRKLKTDIGKDRLSFLSSITMGHFAVHWYHNMLFLALPFIKEDLKLTDIQIGIIVTVYTASNGTFILISGFLADSFRRKGTIIVSSALVSFGIGLFVIGIAPSYIWILIGAGMIGLATALWHPPAMRALSLQFPNHRGTALAIHGMGASLGDSLGPIVVGAIIVTMNWTLAMELHLIPALIIAFFLWRSLSIMRETDAEKTTIQTYMIGIRSLFSNKQILAIMTSNSLIQMSRLSMFAFFPIYIKETLDYSAFVLGIYLALLYAMGIVSQPIMGLLSDHIGRKKILVPSFTLMGLCYISIVAAPAGISLALIIGVLGMFFYAILNVNQSAIMDVSPKEVQASTMSAMSLFSQPFIFGSPILAGYLVTVFGIKSSFLYAGVTAFLAVATLLPVRFQRTLYN